MRRFLPLLLSIGWLTAVAPVASASPCGSHPWCDPSLPPDVRAGMVVRAMTAQEKYELMGGQITQQVNSLNEGIARLGIPQVNITDGPGGVRKGLNAASAAGATTAMPAPLALAAAWDPTLANSYGATVATEARNNGDAVLLAPTMNILRTPLNGRTFEAFGEDPFLTSRVAVGYIEGVQSRGVMADPKHFAANNQEGVGFAPPVGGQVGNRNTTNAVVGERALREIYLPHFEAAVTEAHAASVMAAYNKVNGQYMAENSPLNVSILKGEWKFPGFLLSDYGATHNTLASVNNGLDLELPQALFYRPETLAPLVAGQMISTQAIDDHVRRILREMFRFGLVDEGERPGGIPDDVAAHAAVAQDVAERGAVLLRNEGGVLPLAPARLRRVALVGPQVDANKGGGGSAEVKPYTAVTPRQAITARLPATTQVVVDDGSDASRAAAAAKGADVAVVLVADDQTEFGDKSCLTLECPSDPSHRVPDQDALVSAVAAANPNTVVVLEAGGPVLTPWLGEVQALLEAWYPGEQGGAAIARLLFGDVNPSGKLPATFPRQAADEPVTTVQQYPGVAENAEYSEGVMVGYRHFDARRIAPQFPFGFGLSYTSFAFGALRVGADGVSFTVRNTGRRPGAEVAQLYLGLPQPSPQVEQPPNQLKGFARVELAPGASRVVTLPITTRALSYWDELSSSWQVAPGCYAVAVGSSSRDLPLRATFPVGGARCPGAGRAPAAARRCASRRRFAIRLPAGSTSGRVVLRGRRVPLRRRGGRLVASIDLRGRPGARVRVRVTAHVRGRVVHQTRTYRTCTRR